ncbi:MAG: alpha-galactosidase [Lachnospiraceae bacterium]|nr:alpha-galactosidase [Lachnospiraceae bacterium]
MYVVSKAEIKIVGDEYAGFYSCGLTMMGSATMRRFGEITEENGNIVMRSEDGLLLSVSTTKSPYSNAYEVRTSFTNGSGSDVTLEMITSFLLPGIKADRVHRILSFWSAEGRLKTDDLRDLNMECAWNHMAFRVGKFGNVGSMPVRKFFPFVALEDSESGEFTAVQLYSPSSWQIELIVREGNEVNLSGGIADRDLGQWTKTLRPGETLEAPKAVVARGHSLEEACDRLVKAQHPSISPIDDHMGITFNEYCTTWGNPTIDNLKKLADKLEGRGIQFLVMDSGWYSDCGYWWEHRGDWSVNRKRFPNGLKELADYIRAKGMIPGIWFEFEVAGPKSGVFDDPAHFVKKDGVPLTVGGARFWDMEDPYVEEYLTENVIGRLREDGFGYIKIDYNDTMGMGCDGPESPGENLRRKVLATQSFFRKLREEIPGLVIENCSSGGHRLEPSFMELASQASFSDAHEIVSLPLIAANLHRVVRPEQCQIWAVLRAEDPEERIVYSLCATLLGRMGLSGDIYDLNEKQSALLDEAIAFYREAAPVIRDGITTHICADTKSYNEPTGSQLVLRRLGDRLLCVYHRFAGSVPIEAFAKKHGINLTGYRLQQKYGDASCDFSAEARLLSESNSRQPQVRPAADNNAQSRKNLKKLKDKPLKIVMRDKDVLDEYDIDKLNPITTESKLSHYSCKSIGPVLKCD